MGYTKEFCEKLKKLYSKGFTYKEIADMVKIDENTVKFIVHY